MFVTRRTTEITEVLDDKMQLIARLEVTPIKGITNGYAVNLTLAKANSDPQEYDFTAASKPDEDIDIRGNDAFGV